MIVILCTQNSMPTIQKKYSNAEDFCTTFRKISVEVSFNKIQKYLSAEDQYNCTAKRVIWGKESSINHVPL